MGGGQKNVHQPWALAPYLRVAAVRCSTSLCCAWDDGCKWGERKHSACCLSLSLLPQGGGVLTWGKVAFACNANRLAPLIPSEFETMMTEGMASGKIKFTVRCLPSNRQPVDWC